LLRGGTLKPGVQKSPRSLVEIYPGAPEGDSLCAEKSRRDSPVDGGKNYVAGDIDVNVQVLKTYTYRASVSGARESILRNSRDKIGIVDQLIDVNVLTDNVFVVLPGVPDSF
jgi:hypothetical protein